MTDSKVAIVTGASSGIGEATARLFAKEGYRVVLAARRLERLQALQAEIEAGGGTALAVQTDITKLADIQHMVAETLSVFGQVDVLVNNAGFGRVKWLDQLDPVDDIEAMLRTNLLGAIQAAQAVLPHMIERRTGHIIHVSSVAGHLAPPTLPVYSATKFGMVGFAEGLQREVGIYNIHVSVVSPGGVATEYDQHAQAYRKTGITTPKIIQLTGDDVARAILRLTKRPRKIVIIPAIMRIPVALNTLFPRLVDWVIEIAFTRRERV
jgi:NADP-dependent 3-hydroxy acid dehydrogenase YdfG